MYRALVGVGVICALLIVSVFLFTRAAIKENRRQVLERAIFNVLPGASTKLTFVLADNNVRVLDLNAKAVNTKTLAQSGGALIYAGYDTEHKLVGLAIKAQGMGYQDTIRILYGYAPESQAIVGMQVLESKETPGLGDKIEKDKSFRSNFVKLDVTLTADGGAIKNPIVAVKPGQKNEHWQIDGITGATISSRAIADILKGSTTRWIPLVHRNVQTFGSATGDNSD